MSPLSFLFKKTTSNKIKSLLHPKYIIIFAFVLITIFSEFSSEAQFEIKDVNILHNIYILFLLGWIIITSFFFMLKTKKELTRQDIKFLFLAPIPPQTVYIYHLRRKLALTAIVSFVLTTLIVLKLFQRFISIQFLIKSIGVNAFMIFIALTIISILSKKAKSCKYIKHLSMVAISVLGILFIYGLVCFIQNDFNSFINIAKKLPLISNVYNINFGTLMPNDILVLICTSSVLFLINRKINLKLSTEDIYTTQPTFKKSKVIKKEQSISNIAKKILVEQTRNRSFIFMYLAMTLFGCIISVFCVGLCQSFLAFNKLIIDIFTYIFGMFVGFICNVEVFSNELKKHYIRLIPQNPIRKFCELSLTHFIIQCVVGMVFILISCLFTNNATETIYAFLLYASTIIVSLSGELCFNKVYRTDDIGKMKILIVANSIIKLFLLTPSMALTIIQPILNVNLYGFNIILNILIAFITVNASKDALV